MSENESDILSIADSDIEYLTPDEAKTKIDAVMRAGPTHPYFDNSNLKLHRVAGEKMSALFRVTSPDELQTDKDGQVVVGQWPPHMVKIMGEALEIQEAKRQKLLAQAEEDMDALVIEHDFTRAEIPDDLEIWQANLLHAQRLNVGKPTPDNLRELNLILEKESYGVPFDTELRQAIQYLSQARLTLGKNSPEEFGEIAEKVIFMIDKAHEKQKAKKGKR